MIFLSSCLEASRRVRRSSYNERNKYKIMMMTSVGQKYIELREHIIGELGTITEI